VQHLPSGATNIAGVRNIRSSRIDYDGDGDISEGVAGEIDTMMERLLITIRLYDSIDELGGSTRDLIRPTTEK
jgi:hypothetical protein